MALLLHSARLMREPGEKANGRRSWLPGTIAMNGFAVTRAVWGPSAVIRLFFYPLLVSDFYLMVLIELCCHRPSVAAAIRRG